MLPFGVLNTTWHLVLRGPKNMKLYLYLYPFKKDSQKRDHHFDNHSYSLVKSVWEP